MTFLKATRVTIEKKKKGKALERKSDVGKEQKCVYLMSYQHFISVEHFFFDNSIFLLRCCCRRRLFINVLFIHFVYILLLLYPSFEPKSEREESKKKKCTIKA